MAEPAKQATPSPHADPQHRATAQQSDSPSANHAGTEKLDVIFIDKYIDPAKSLALLKQLQEKFLFSEHTLQQLASGYPVVVKHDTDADTARKLVEYIHQLGGDCWLQASNPEGFIDRREENRRLTVDRRLLHRGWAIVPDRRKTRERRVYFH